MFSRELKDNLGNDEPEGEMPVLLQTLLARNPKIFRDKSMKMHYNDAEFVHVHILHDESVSFLCHRCNPATDNTTVQGLSESGAWESSIKLFAKCCPSEPLGVRLSHLSVR